MAEYSEEESAKEPLAVVPKPSLKQEWDLDLADFTRSPVWVCTHGIDEDEPWYEHTDEATYRPWTGPLPVDPAMSRYRCFATFTLSDGRIMNGSAIPVRSDWKKQRSLGIRPRDFAAEFVGQMQPTVFVGRQGFSFWLGLTDSNAPERNELCAALNSPASAVFPIDVNIGSGLALGITQTSVAGVYHLKFRGRRIVPVIQR